MLTRFRGLAGVVTAFLISFLMSCSGGSHNSSSTDTMYAATQNSGQIWGYRANFNNGTLANINGSPFSSQNGSGSIVIDPAHNFAYVSGFDPTTGTSDIQRFSIDSNGSLVAVTPNTPVGNSQISAMVMDSGGKFLFVASQLANSITVFSVGANAALSPVSCASCAVTSPVGLAITPSSAFLYAVDSVNSVVDIFAVNASSGALTQALPPNVPVGNTPSAATINPAGTLLYITNAVSNDVSGFIINSDGSLTPMTQSPFPAGTQPAAAAVDPSGQYLYVVDHGSNQISAYRITAVNGNLVAVGGSPFNSGRGPIAIAISPTNKFLYVSNNTDGTISGFALDPPSGNLSPAAAATTTGIQPGGLAFGR